MRFVCKTECFWKNRLWSPGDMYESDAREKPQATVGRLEPNEVPYHFQPEEFPEKRRTAKNEITNQ